MSARQTPENDDRLLHLMREWRVDDPLPPRFQEQVWNRIARADRKEALPSWVTLLLRLRGMLVRPKVASAYVALLLLCGMVAGSWTAQVKSSRLESSLGARYVQSVDPYYAAASR